MSAAGAALLLKALSINPAHFSVQWKFTVDNNSFNHLPGVILRLFSRCSIFFRFLFLRKKETKNLAQKKLSQVPFARAAGMRALGRVLACHCGLRLF